MGLVVIYHDFVDEEGVSWWTIEIRFGDDIPWFRRQNKMRLWMIEIGVGGE